MSVMASQHTGNCVLKVLFVLTTKKRESSILLALCGGGHRWIPLTQGASDAENLFMSYYYLHRVRVFTTIRLDANSFMMTSSNGHIFRVSGPLWGEFAGHRWIPLTKASDAELWCFLWFVPGHRLSKQSRCRRCETPPRPLWRHINVSYLSHW